MCFDYDGYCDLFCVSKPRARKVYRCCECGRAIAIGEIYLRVFSVYYGDASTSIVCRHCEEVRATIRAIEEGRGCTDNEAVCPFGMLREAIRDDSDHYGFFCGEDCEFVELEAAHLFPKVKLA